MKTRGSWTLALVSLVLVACATTGGAPSADATATKERVLIQEVFVPAPPERVFEAWTTEEGIATFFAPAARVEAKAGGPYEIWFMPDAPEGSRGCDGCRVLEARAPTHLAFTWAFPPSMASIRGQETRVDVKLSPEGDGTRVRLEQTGWKPGEDWDRGYAYFDRAWALVLSRLAQSFESGPIDWSKL